jgi:hypothetical protein
MPLYRVDSELALATIKDNSVGRWPRRGEPGRLSPIAKPQFSPTFHFAPGETIFTIGSCFARHVERELAFRGFGLPTRRLFESDEDFGAVGLDVLNNYGTPSIFNELAWAFDDGFDPMTCFEPVRDNWVDMHLHASIRPTSLDVLRTRRRAIATAYRSITHCRAVIITLGLAEVWFDTRHGIYLNVAPRRSILRDNPGRFELHVLSPQEAYDYLRRALLLIRQHGTPGISVVLTVSPVPLSATYRAMDVMVANSYSKAVLRVAAEQAAAEFDFVDYFPSYESITLSEREHAWTEDNVHVTQRAVATNVGRMVAAYTNSGSELLDIDSMRDRVRELRGNRSEVLALLADRPELLVDAELANAYADAALLGGQLDQAVVALKGGLLEPVLAARIMLGTGDAAGALERLGAKPPQATARSHFYGTRIRALLALAQIDAAIETANDWIAADRSTPQPYLLLARALDKISSAKAAGFYEQALMLGDDQPPVVIECADHMARNGRVAEAQTLVRAVEPVQPYYRRRKQHILSLLG